MSNADDMVRLFQRPFAVYKCGKRESDGYTLRDSAQEPMDDGRAERCTFLATVVPADWV